MKQAQNARKQRGRPAQRKGGRSNNNNNGNRFDNRSRGNPKQLLEKYKTQARDSLQAGDRVNAEYFLQFADHYQRLVNEQQNNQNNQNNQAGGQGGDEKPGRQKRNNRGRQDQRNGPATEEQAAKPQEAATDAVSETSADEKPVVAEKANTDVETGEDNAKDENTRPRRRRVAKPKSEDNTASDASPMTPDSAPVAAAAVDEPA